MYTLPDGVLERVEEILQESQRTRTPLRLERAIEKALDEAGVPREEHPRLSAEVSLARINRLASASVERRHFDRWIEGYYGNSRDPR